MKKTILLYIVYILTVILFKSHKSLGDSRAQVIRLICSNQTVGNVSLYIPNFVKTMDNISTQMQTSGFGLAITGTGIHTSYGLGQCYNDLSLVECTRCYAQARTSLPQCLPDKGGRIYLDGCFMRYDNSTFFDQYEGLQDRVLCESTTFTLGSELEISAREALNKAVESAVHGKGYARAEVAAFYGSDYDGSAYVLADCWKTVNSSGCRECLEKASESLKGCLPAPEGRALYTGCFMRYSDKNFLNPVPVKRKSEGRRKRKELQLLKNDPQSLKNLTEIELDKNLNHIKLEELPLFKLETLSTATDNFLVNNKLGQGGFGAVYKGKLIDGKEIAVKRLSRSSNQGLEEFMNEVVVISKLQHRNLVRLLGCCIEGEEKMLVYEYMPNKSLDAFLFDPQMQERLDWSKRWSIIEGIGRGLLYLHRDSRLKIIHRDLKASNILLDEELNPKISDFGMARIFGGTQNQANTQRVVGTYGYMAPEYAMDGQFSEKSDVFSFGVLLLEIVSGRRNTSFYDDDRYLSLLQFVWKMWNDDNTVAIIDSRIAREELKTVILRCIHIGLLCVHEFAVDRPNISTVLSMLSNEVSSLAMPKQPAFTQRPGIRISRQSQTGCSLNGCTITSIEGR